MPSRSRLLGLLLIGVAASLLLVVGIAMAALPPGGTFIDDDGNVHEGNIEAIAAEGITRGCNPPTNNMYCPTDSLTREQMAAFIRRALSLPAATANYFVDISDSVFESDINAIAEAGITKGCNPPASDRYCPDGNITREQMAAFLRRAFDYPAATVDYFIDDDSSIFEADINAIAKAGVTLGCNPPTNNKYCPTDLVKRDQMASFFSRAIGLTPIVPPPPTTPQPIYVSMWYEFSSDTWNGTAGSESVFVDYATTPYGGGWIGHLGAEPVSLGRSDSAVWTGYIGSESVVMYDNVAVGDFDVAPWTGHVGSQSILLTGGYWAGPGGRVEGFIGSISVSLTCYRETEEGRWGKGTGPRSVAALLPILCESWGYD